MSGARESTSIVRVEQPKFYEILCLPCIYFGGYHFIDDVPKWTELNWTDAILFVLLLFIYVVITISKIKFKTSRE